MAGLPLTASSRVLEEHVAGDDSVAWRRLRERGMVLSATRTRTSSPAGGTTDQVGNPWALDRVGGRLERRLRPRRSRPAWSRPRWALTRWARCGSPRPPAAGRARSRPRTGASRSTACSRWRRPLDHAGPMARSIAEPLRRRCSRRWPRRCPAHAADAAARSCRQLPLEPRPARRPLDGLAIAVLERAPLAPERGRGGPRSARQACERSALASSQLDAGPSPTPARRPRPRSSSPTSGAEPRGRTPRQA